MDRMMGNGWKTVRMAGLVLMLGALAACEDGTAPAFMTAQKKDPAAAASSSGQSTKLVERDVEAPDVFQVTEAGLWDGRPSLGGVWVAHPDVTEPERVIIRNTANNKFVIGALFRRERDIPGPRLQASSDAAAALGMLAGAPVQLNVTALIRESVPVEADPEETTELADAETIAETALDPVAGAAAAIEASETSPAPVDAPATATPVPTPAPAAKPATSSLSKPYVQIGIFSVESNAKSTASQMRSAGMSPTVYEQSANGKAFWRVVVGPAQTKSDLNALLKKSKDAGFSDAYAVSK